MSTLSVGGTRLHVEQGGSGHPLVLVHGSASDHRTWQGLRADLERHHRVIAYSRRHHWPNAPIAAGDDYDMHRHVDDLAALVRHTCTTPIDLIGHSYGAFVSLLYAMDHATSVRSLVLVEPPVLTLFTSDPPRLAELVRLSLSRPATALAIARFGMRGLAPAVSALERGDRDGALRTFGGAVLGAEHFAGLSTARLAQARDNFIDSELLGSGFPPLDADRVATMPRPTLLVSGARSPRIWTCFIERLAELLPRAERAEISGSSHIVHEDQPAAFLSAVTAFHARVGATRAAADPCG